MSKTMLFPFTAFLVHLYFSLFCCKIIYDGVKLYQNGMNRHELNEFFIPFIIWILTYAAVYFSKFLVDQIYDGLNIGKFSRCRNNVFFGLGGIAIVSILGRFEFSVVTGTRNKTLFIYFLISLLAAIYNTVVYAPSKMCHVKKSTSRTYHIIFFIIACLHFVCILAPVVTALHYNKTVKYTHIGLALICATSTLELFPVLMGRLRLVEDGGLNTINVVSPAAPGLVGSERIELI